LQSSSDAAADACGGIWNTDHVWDIEDFFSGLFSIVYRLVTPVTQSRLIFMVLFRMTGGTIRNVPLVSNPPYNLAVNCRWTFSVVRVINKVEGILSAVHPNRSAHIPEAIEIPILCKFWMEDGVWNGVAAHLPVAVFGHSLEEVQKNLFDALLTHLDAEQQLGTIAKTVAYLRACAKENCLTLEDIPPNRLLARFNAALQDEHVMALA